MLQWNLKSNKNTEGNNRMAGKKKQTSCCDTCSNYVYDEDYEYYTCEMNLDEDEMGKFMTDSFYDCPYYQYDDEYAIVRKQN